MSCTGGRVEEIGIVDNHPDTIRVLVIRWHPDSDEEHYGIDIDGDPTSLMPFQATDLADLLTKAARRVAEHGGDDEGVVERG